MPMVRTQAFMSDIIRIKDIKVWYLHMYCRESEVVMCFLNFRVIFDH